MSGSVRESRVAVAHTCPAPAGRVWDTLVDWELHDRWMVLTRARGGSGEGARVLAFTGIGPVGFSDPMEITGWRPPSDDAPGHCEVLHRGAVVRGRGRFDLEPLPGGRCLVTWSEWVRLPPGPVGRLAGPLVRVLTASLFRRSLRNLGGLARRRSRSGRD
ncbi:SRPBCC family protein [Actinorugispora endophytica]|uniref:Polyketide cyclase/dehydrase/lipid transport protein n=1 Tax=Actinorugispora endophytica TaxID=1605990 RepID=A0A4R6V2Z4_9ACTN|nr:SRPBCC family protein [Actinorugispora endophytica]TDQ54755.1 polyketide cyclase/dehydrase/lipid transport protein [Actinorugispora endophytica]